MAPGLIEVQGEPAAVVIDADGEQATPSKPKQTRKRRSAAQTPAEALDIEVTTDQVGGFIALIFVVLAITMGDHWKLEQTEVDALSTPTTAIIKRAAPQMQKQIVQSSDYIALAMALVAVVGPRVAMQGQLQAEKKAAKRQPIMDLYGGADERPGTDEPGTDELADARLGDLSAGGEGQAPDADRGAGGAVRISESDLAAPQELVARVAQDVQ